MNNNPSPLVAILVPNLKGAGSQRAQLHIARGLVELGVRVDLVVCRDEGDFSDSEIEGVRRINIKSILSHFPVNALVRYLKNERPLAVISALNQANLLALLSIRLARTDTKVIAVVQNHFGAKWKNQFTPTALFRKLLFHFVYIRADEVVAVSRELERYLINILKIPEKKVLTIPNPVDVDEVRNNAMEVVYHPWLKKPRKIPVLISVGRLDRQKDHRTLFRAIARIVPRRQIRILLLGKGPWENKLRREAKKLGLWEYVDWLGFQKNPHAWMARSDLFVLSSLWEGYPLVLLESVALGVPTISTDCASGPKEILREELLVPAGDDAQLAALIEKVLAASPQQGTTICELMTPKTCAEAYLRCIRMANEG